MEEKKLDSKIDNADKVKIYYDKLKEYDSTFLTNTQKEVILNSLKFIIENQINTKNYQLNEFFKLLTQRVKTGFVFDEVPKSFNGFISIPKEIKKNKMKSFNGSNEKNNIDHLLFIGENYDVLKNLLITHKEKISIIYIDPPYNTDSANSEGNFLSDEKEKNTNKKFIYRDRFSRTGWLNMMKERLILAKDLLSKDGVIFISIDDNEHAYLKVLMDEIFHEENFICDFIWESNPKGRQISNKYSQSTEHILCYAKKFNEINDETFSKIPITYLSKEQQDKLRKEFSYHDNEGYFRILPLKNSNQKFNSETRKKLFYPLFYNKENEKIKIYRERDDDLEIWPKNFTNNVEGVWRWGKNKVEKENEKLFFKNEDKQIYTKEYWEEKLKKGSNLKNIIKNEIGSTSDNAKREMKLILGDKNTFASFTPKPMKLVKLLIKSYSLIKKDITVLDFFAGSGTTGHAVMKLNEKDNGQRKFILATNNENNIAQDITYERLYRIIKGNSTNGHNDFEWINNNRPFTNNNLKVFELNEIKVTPDQKLFDLSSEIINEYKKIDPSLKLNNKSDIFFKLSSLEQRIDLGKENEINK